MPWTNVKGQKCFKHSLLWLTIFGVVVLLCYCIFYSPRRLYKHLLLLNPNPSTTILSEQNATRLQSMINVTDVLSTTDLYISTSQLTPTRFPTADLHREFAFSPEGPHDVIVFLHIQKTGGTTFGKNLVQNLRLNQACECTKGYGLLHCPCLSSDKQRHWLFSRYSEGWKCGLHADFTELTECLAGGKMDDIEGFQRLRRYLMITVIRQPLQRYISEWFHVNRGAVWLGATLRCNGRSPSLIELPYCFSNDTWEGVSLSEFTECPYNLAHNRQTRMLANLSLVNCYSSGYQDNEDLKEIMLQSAKHNLKQMAFFGIMRYPNETQFLFEHTFGLRFKVPFVQQKRKKDHGTEQYVSSLSQTVKTKIQQLNDLDIQLYNYAEELFFQRYEYAKNLKKTRHKIESDDSS